MDCSQLVKMVSEPEEWPGFASYLEDIKTLKWSINSSELIHLLRTQNLRTDSLARSARKQKSFVVHMDAELPVWFAETTWIYLRCWQKKKNGQQLATVVTKHHHNFYFYLFLRGYNDDDDPNIEYIL